MNEVIIPEHQWPEGLFYSKLDDSIDRQSAHYPGETRRDVSEFLMMMLLMTIEPAGTA